MEILQPGKLPPPPNEDYRGECQRCHCKVKCTPTDPAILPYSRSNPVYRVECPTVGCGELISLSEYVTRESFVVRSNEREFGHD